MNNNEIVNRDEILGNTVQSYNFDKAIRGYDTKQVDDFIKNLVQSNKSASELFDNRLKDLQNTKEMLQAELNHTKEKLEESQSSYNKLKDILEGVKKERDTYKNKAETEKKTIIQDNSTQITELQERLDKALTKNRLLQDENRKLEEQNRDLQRDVAHLSKKVDKNRSKISDLTGQVESGMTNDDSKKYSEIAKIYESAIDKAEDLIYRLQTEFSLAHSKAEDVNGQDK